MTKTLQYDWVHDIEPYLDSMQPVEGGYTLARRGMVTLADGSKAFVKMAEGETTKRWLRKEIIVYKKLGDAGYPYIPQILSHNDNYSAMAIEYLDSASFENIWDKDKLDAILNAQQELRNYKHIFLDDVDFTLESVVGLDPRWPDILARGNIEKINEKFENLGVETSFTKSQIESYERMLDGWKIAADTLVHQDIRADNFGYNPATKQGKLVDWNWLCIGDASLDRTPLFVNMFISGFDPYAFHSEKYDPQMLIYLISFWLERVLVGDETASDLAFKRSHAQASSVKACVELLSRQAIR